MSEYPRGRRHARYLVQELLPAVTARYAISDDPQDRVLLGASLGAVASLATAFRYPGVFGGLILKSGSFILDPTSSHQRPHPVFHRVARLVQAFRRAPDLPADARIRLDRRTGGAGRREPCARRPAARQGRRRDLSELVGRAPLAQLARPVARRSDLGVCGGRHRTRQPRRQQLRRQPTRGEGHGRPQCEHRPVARRGYLLADCLRNAVRRR